MDTTGVSIGDVEESGSALDKKRRMKLKSYVFPYVYLIVFVVALMSAAGILVTVFLKDNVTLPSQESTIASEATKSARALTNIPDVYCEDDMYICWTDVVVKDVVLNFPLLRWNVTDEFMRLEQFEGFESCLNQLSGNNSSYSSEKLISLSFQLEECPFPSDTLKFDFLHFPVVAVSHSNGSFSFLDPVREKFVLDYPAVIYSYTRNVAAKERNSAVNVNSIVLVDAENENQLICLLDDSQLTLSTVFSDQCIFQVSFAVGSVSTSLLQLVDAFEPSAFSEAPTLQPTTVPTSSPTTQEDAFNQKYRGSRPNIVFIMLDDLGWGDVAFTQSNPRDKIEEATKFISDLATKESVVLRRHYGHWHCSPSRRSFLVGRWPIHTGEQLSRQGDDHLDLRFEWISEKLKQANYTNYLLGKTHFGYKSVYHLPTLRGFDEFVGILAGQNNYLDFTYWNGTKGNVTEDLYYSNRVYTDAAIEFVTKHSKGNELEKDPFFLQLNLQTPHTPIEPPSVNSKRYDDFKKKTDYPYEFMIYSADTEIKNFVAHLKDNDLWDNTLLVFTSDNGATQQPLHSAQSPFKGWKTRGSNFPLRGEKKTSFEGSFKVPTFISGGLVPASLRGKSSGVISHISDWFASFCFLAGVDVESGSEDEKHIKEFLQDVYTKHDVSKISPRNPSVENADGEQANLWGNSYPAPDSINIIRYLLDETIFADSDFSHDFHASTRENEVLGLSAEAMIYKDYKIILAQPCSFYVGTTECNNFGRYGWIKSNAKSFTEEKEANNIKLTEGCIAWNHPYEDIVYKPCFFNLTADEQEKNPIDNSTQLEMLYALFNETLLTQYTSLLPGKEDGLTPVDFPVSDTPREVPIEELGAIQDRFFGTLDSPTADLGSCRIVDEVLQCLDLSQTAANSNK